MDRPRQMVRRLPDRRPSGAALPALRQRRSRLQTDRRPPCRVRLLPDQRLSGSVRLYTDRSRQPEQRRGTTRSASGSADGRHWSRFYREVRDGDCRVSGDWVARRRDGRGHVAARRPGDGVEPDRGKGARARAVRRQRRDDARGCGRCRRSRAFLPAGRWRRRSDPGARDPEAEARCGHRRSLHDLSRGNEGTSAAISRLPASGSCTRRYSCRRPWRATASASCSPQVPRMFSTRCSTKSRR